MTKQEEVAKWREIGQAFERLSVTGTGPLLVTCGLCYAMQLSGLPAYYGHARLTTEDHHGPCLQWNGRFGSGIGPVKKAAAHRALTAYLMAEMVQDDSAPGEATD